MNGLYICVEGNIGVGKTTLVKTFESDSNAITVYEQFLENPFLEAFYKNPTENALAVELAFLTNRYLQLKEVFRKKEKSSKFFIADFSFYKCLVFARINLENEDLRTYTKYFFLLAEKLPKPNLIFFLNSSLEQTTANIAQRGRPMEKTIALEYLLKIEASYESFMSEFSPQIAFAQGEFSKNHLSSISFINRFLSL